MACCLPSPQGCWCFGDSLPEKPAYTGEICKVTGTVLISQQNPCQPVGGWRWGARGWGGRGLLACFLPPRCLQPSSQAPGPWATINCPSALINWVKGSPTSSPRCVPLATVAMETACNLVNS